ncbi:hypothetical protein E2C01_006978 [Portunus trituberculatus]|uniref:Uncharacterized protein n=1 Tax=Portunus trituberculatus TaxID=210409 RepID=A0A5B7CY83_PORTR|nr:hypothetical protein [Portunus trituberculatus]
MSSSETHQVPLFTGGLIDNGRFLGEQQTESSLDDLDEENTPLPQQTPKKKKTHLWLFPQHLHFCCKG